LEIPIIWVEQLPDKLGPSIQEISELLPDQQPIVKNTFSCCRTGDYVETLKGYNRSQVLIAGIETHICIYQTVMELVDLGFEAHVVTDCVSSRTEANKLVGLNRMKDIGAILTSVETAVFELLKVAQGDKFREIIKIIK
jgi:nicotinamidase-related amidase